MAPKRFQQPAPISYLCVPAAAGVQRWGGENVARGLVPRLGGEQVAHRTIPSPSHPNILDTQHRYSGESRSPGVVRGKCSAGACPPPGWGKITIGWKNRQVTPIAIFLTRPS